MRRAWMVVTAALAVGAAPRVARACGGFFCSSSPVDQAGERIVYGLESDGTLTMAVEIAYAGDDDDFAWIVPVVAPPEVTLGTEALFDALDRATVPMFDWDERTEGTCRPHPQCVYASGAPAYDGGGGGGCGYDESPMPWSGGYVDARPAGRADDASTADLGLPDDGVRVFSEASVGPYDTVVLGSTSAMEVIDWLHEHDYDVPAASLPLLEPYAAAGNVFVALRLSTRRDSSVLRPIVMRMQTTEACLPIRLTSIATLPNLPITAFFLGSELVRSQNFSFVDIDTVNPAFWNGSRTWASTVTQAVDAAGGKAFATDYAGPTPAVSIELPSVTDLATITDPVDLVDRLLARGYMGDAVLFDLLSRHLVPPAGRDARTYYNCLARGGYGCGAPVSFDPAGLVAAIDSTITRPRADAQALVLRHGRLTRLFTTMSAADMTLDPVFVPDPDAAPVSNVYLATRVTECSDRYYAENAPQRWEIEGRSFPYREGWAASDAAYCRSLGAYLPGTGPAPPRSDDGDSGDGGCGCRTHRALPVHGGALVLALLLIVWRRVRRTRER